MPTESRADAPDAEVRRLYGLEPGEFVTARAAAARELRREGRRGEAAAVERLRKPSVAAWIVNRLARDEAGLVGGLLEAGERLREVQLRAGSPGELRAAIDAEAAALEALMRKAGPLGARSGSGGEATLRHARDTLHAAALDPGLAGEVRRGVVVREQQAVGFPMGVSVPARRPRPAARKPEPAPRKAPATDPGSARQLERAAASAAAATVKLAAAEAELAGAQDDLEAAEADLEAARAAATTAERRTHRAQQAVAAAGRAHDDASRKAQAAVARHRELGGAG
jgi:hypothetical protein